MTTAPSRAAPSRPSERTRLGPEERRAQLVALGVATLADRPLDALTVSGLARDAGISRGLVFHYFGSADGLHRAVLEKARDAMLHATEPSSDLGPRERLRDTLRRTVGFVRDHGGTFASLVRGPASMDAEARAVVDQVRASQAHRVVDVFVESGVPDSARLRRTARAWIAFAEETLVGVALDPRLATDDLVDDLVGSAEAVVAALQPAGA